MNNRAFIFGPIAALVVIAIWFVALWSPTNNSLNRAKDRRSAAEAQESQLAAQLERLKAAQRDEPAKRARLEVLKAAIPETPALAEFILDANDAANRAGIDFLSITQTPPAAAPVAVGSPPNPIALTFAITGGYFQVLDFVNRLGALPRLVAFDDLTLSPGEVIGGVQRISASITGKMFTNGGLVATPPPGTPAAPGVTTTTVAGATTTTAAA